MLAGEQAAQLEQVELRATIDVMTSAISGSCDSSSTSRASSCSTSTSSSCGGEAVERLDVVLDAGVVGVDLLGVLGVVPQIRPGDLRFELDQPVAAVGDLQVLRGLGRGVDEDRAGRR